MAPTALQLLIGYVLIRFKVFKKSDFATLSSFAFKFLLPFLFFNSMRNANFAAEIDLFQLLVYIGLQIASVLFAWFYGAKLVKEPNMKGPAIQAFCRTNMTIFALPIAKLLFDISELTTMILFMALVIPLLNLISVVGLAAYGDDVDEQKTKITFKDLARTIITSPVILGTIVGIIMNPIQQHITIPESIDKVFTSFGSMATSMLLISVGGSINLENVKHYAKELFRFMSISMVIKPLICCIVMITLGLRGAPLVCGTLIMGTPAPVATVGMAQAQNRDHIYAGLIVSFCSLISVLTLFLFIFALGSLGFVDYNFGG